MNKEGVVGIGLIVRLVLLAGGIMLAFPIYPYIAGAFTGGLVQILANIVTLAVLGVGVVIGLALPYIRMVPLGLIAGLLLIHFFLSGVI